MGMDVYGKSATSENGEYFRNSIWWWHPLWDYCHQTAKDLIDLGLLESGHSNNGVGLGANASKELAARLREELKSGRTKAHEEIYMAELKTMPSESCRICEGTGKRQPPPNVGVGLEPCNGCDSTGSVRPFATSYPFSSENVEEFCTFLEDCGGFEIC